MKYLFVTWDGGGNLHGVLPLAARLVARGHEVAFLGHRSQQAQIEARGCAFAAFERAPDTAPSWSDRALLDDWRTRSPLRLAALYRDRLMVGPAARIAEDVLAAIAADPPDAMAVDFMLLGALIAAEKAGLPTAVLWHCPYMPPTVEVPVHGSGGRLPRGLPGRLLQQVQRELSRAWWRRSLPAHNANRAAFGLAPLQSIHDQTALVERVLVTNSPAFDFAGLSGATLAPSVRYIGTAGRRARPALPAGRARAAAAGAGQLQHDLPGAAGVDEARGRSHRRAAVAASW